MELLVRNLWQVDDRYLVIEIRPGVTYEVPADGDPERWIEQVAEKSWASGEIVADLKASFGALRKKDWPEKGL